MNGLYKFLGFHLVEINFSCVLESSINEIRLNLESYNFNKQNQVDIIANVEIDFENSKKNKFKYVAGYEIENKECPDSFNKEKDINEYLSLFFTSLFPFIRENISSVTKDSVNHILLPTIDCRAIPLQESLVLTPTK